MSFIGIILTAIFATMAYIGWIMVGNGFFPTVIGLVLLLMGGGGYLGFIRKNFIVAILVGIVVVTSIQTSIVKFWRTENARQHGRAY